MPVTAIDSFSDFQKIINSDKVVVIDFWAPWCGPCRAISPVFEHISTNSDYSHIEFYKVDTDANEDISQEVGIRALPTFMAFKGGVKIEEVVGASPSSVQQIVQIASSA
ncbi:thioredoxin [Penicillium verhagenii]|nr:thioredoxin [Penicillium verhagenii]